jgi:glyoxylase-like metal-dependent hydrolase (beta-lactamase superfamily II)
MCPETIGRLNEQSSVRRRRIDDVTFTFVVDGAMSIAPQSFLSAIPADYWDEHPGQLDRHGRVAMSAGGLLVERKGHRLLIDAGFGQHAERAPFGRINCGAFLDVLSQLGLRRTDIDAFALTHIHVDHTGWAFVDSPSGSRRPAFPNVPYFVSAREWEPLRRGERSAGVPGESTLIEPLGALAELRLIGEGDEVAPNAVAVVTPGHSAGHTSYVVTTSKGNRLVAFGDCFHTPAQLSRPEWLSDSDAYPEVVVAARRRILAELCAPNTVGFATHFGDQPFGVVTDALTWQPLPTTALLAPPRSV